MSSSEQLRAARALRARDAKRRARADAARQRRAQARAHAAAFAAKHGLTFALLRRALRSRRALAKDLLQRLRAAGFLTLPQTRLLLRLGAPPRPPAPSGRVTFEAVVESVKARGATGKVIVRAAGGFRVRMTADPGGLTPGLRVTVTATLEPSAEDPGFAVGRRPRLCPADAPATPDPG